MAMDGRMDGAMDGAMDGHSSMTRSFLEPAPPYVAPLAAGLPKGLSTVL